MNLTIKFKVIHTKVCDQVTQKQLGWTRGDYTREEWGTMRGSSATRGGQAEVLPDRRQWHSKKLRGWRKKGNTTTSQGRQEA